MCQSLHFHWGPTSKPDPAHCFCDVAAGPENAQTEKCDVGQITELCALNKREKQNFGVKTLSPGYVLSMACVACCLHIIWPQRN